MTAPRVYVEAVDTGWKVHIRWPTGRDEPATTVLHGPGYGSDHLGYTPTIPADAVELGPLPAPRRPLLGRSRTTETR